MHHYQIACAERAVEPVGIAQASGKLAQPVANAVLDQRHTVLAPRLVTLEQPAVTSSRIGGSTVLTAANIQVIACARALASSGSRPEWLLGDMEDDGPGLEQGEIAFFIGWDLPKRMKRQMRRFLHFGKGNETDFVWLGQPPRGPSERACPAPVPDRDRETLQRQ